MELKIEYLPIKKLKIDDRNARKHQDYDVNQIAISIKKYGFDDPIGIWGKENLIVEGHGRLAAAKKMKMEKVPCIRLDHLTEEERREYAIIHNKSAELSEWDFDKLEDELKDLNFDDFDINWGLEEDEIEIVEDEIPEVDEDNEPKSKEGDLYILGNHRVLCGDSTNEENIKRLFGDEKAKCLFTSPPYNIGGGMYETYKDNLESKKYIDFNLDIYKKWQKHIKGYIFWNISYNKNSRWEFIEILYRIVKETGMKFLELIVWDKGWAMPICSKDGLTRQYEDILMMQTEEMEEMDLYYVGTNESKAVFNKKKGKGISNYWKISNQNTQLKNHKACFPVGLPAKAIQLTTDKGDIVCDCFGGSGSTLIACEQLERKCYTCELDPKYVDVIIERWEKFTGKKAVRIE